MRSAKRNTADALTTTRRITDAAPMRRLAGGGPRHDAQMVLTMNATVDTTNTHATTTARLQRRVSFAGFRSSCRCGHGVVHTAQKALPVASASRRWHAACAYRSTHAHAHLGASSSKHT